MDLVITEYEVNTRERGAFLVKALQSAGYDVKHVIGSQPQDLSYYQVWSDGTVTRDENAVDMPEVLADGFKREECKDFVNIRPYRK